MVLNQVGALDHILTEFKPVLNNNSLFVKIEEDLHLALNLHYAPEEKFAIITSNIHSKLPIIAKQIISMAKLGHHYQELGQILAFNMELLHNMPTLNDIGVLKLVKNLDIIRKPQRFNQLEKVLKIITTDDINDHLTFLKNITESFKQIEYSKLDSSSQNNFLTALNTKKLEVISGLRKQHYRIK